MNALESTLEENLIFYSHQLSSNLQSKLHVYNIIKLEANKLDDRLLRGIADSCILFYAVS